MDEITLGSGLKAPADFGFDISPQLKYVNQQVAIKHEEENAPMVKAIAAAAQPNATPENRVAAADALKNATGSTEFRGGDFLQSLANLNFRDMYISATGGSDVRTEAWDQNGNKYIKVFNQRITKQNPYGEFRRYETVDGKVLTPEEQQGKVIVSQVEVPLTLRPFYEAQNVTAKDVASATGQNWLNLQKTAAAANLAAPELKAITDQNALLLPKLQGMSVNPQTRALLAGVSELRTGNTQQLKSASEKLKEFANGKGTSKEWADFKNSNGGITVGLNYNEGKGLSNSDGSTTTNTDIDKNVQSFASQMGSSNAVQARKDDLMQRAQALALDGKIENFDALQQYINNEFKKASLIASIEKHGGIGIAKPNLDFQTGDSFSLAYTKNELDKAYADLASHYGNTVAQSQKILNGTVPAIGQIEKIISSDPFVTKRKKDAIDNIANFEKTIAPTQAEINKQGLNPNLLNQPEAQTPKSPSVPPTVESNTKKISGSKAPVKKSSGQQTLANIFGG